MELISLRKFRFQTFKKGNMRRIRICIPDADPDLEANTMLIHAETDLKHC